MVVPGKVLGTGAIDKKLVVGAFSFSSSARRKILDAGGEALSIEELVKRYPAGEWSDDCQISQRRPLLTKSRLSMWTRRA